MGYETWLEKKKCHDCPAEPGELHEPGCDVEQCPVCGFQAISCGHGLNVLDETGEFWDERLPWTGVWSMVEEAVEYGFYVRWEGPMPGGCWTKCTKDHPEAMPSRNDVVDRCQWDRTKKRFVKP